MRLTEALEKRVRSFLECGRKIKEDVRERGDPELNRKMDEGIFKVNTPYGLSSLVTRRSGNVHACSADCTRVTRGYRKARVLQL